MAEPSEEISARIAENRDRQRALYGAPLGERVRRLTGLLRVSQARLARALGLSPAMLSQLASGRRVKIGDRADWRWAQWAWSVRGAGSPGRPGPGRAVRAEPASRTRTPADALRGIAEPARLTAAAAALGPAFPELAEVLRQAAGRPRSGQAD